MVESALFVVKYFDLNREIVEMFQDTLAQPLTEFQTGGIFFGCNDDGFAVFLHTVKYFINMADVSRCEVVMVWISYRCDFDTGAFQLVHYRLRMGYARQQENQCLC